METFADRLARFLKERRERQEASRRVLDETMLIEAVDAVARDARIRRVIAVCVKPALTDLASRFAGAEVVESFNGDRIRALTLFPHSDAYPCTAELEFSAVALDRTRLELRRRATIVPVLMDLPNDASLEFGSDAAGEEEVKTWVEKEIFSFLEYYLAVESHPAYQDGRMVEDPVCHMRFRKSDAASSITAAGRPIYFCSQACRQVFESRTVRGNPEGA